MIRALSYWILGALLTFFLWLVAFIVYFLNGRNSDFPHKIGRLWSRIILKFLCGSKLHIKGLDNIEKSESYIIVSNHRSLTDIFIALASVPLQFRWLAKKSLFKLPLIGFGMKMSGYIPVEREKAFRAAKSLDIIKEKLAAQKSIWIFPEGTRTPKKELGKFKRGAFILAKETGHPVLPVVLVNSDKIFESPFKVNPTNVYVIILEPISYKNFLEKSKDEKEALQNMMKDVREKIQKVYDEYVTRTEK